MVYTYFHGPKRVGKAKELRRVQTTAEKLLWENLRGKRLSGFKFRRQHPIFEYIVDFYCPEKMLVIEIDGPYHKTNEQGTMDSIRDQELQDKKRIVLRFTNSEVESSMEEVLEKILELLLSLPSVKREYNYKTSPSRDPDLSGERRRGTEGEENRYL